MPNRSPQPASPPAASPPAASTTQPGRQPAAQSVAQPGQTRHSGQTDPHTPQPAADPLAFAKQVLADEATAVRQLIDRVDQSFVSAVQTITACTGNVIVSGLGKSGHIARKLSATLASTGTPSHFLHPAEATHGDLGRIQPDDIAILLSYSGNTDEVVDLAALLQHRNTTVIAMLSSPDSPLGKLADINIALGPITEPCPNNLAPTASTTAMLALGDALALTVSRAKNFNAESFHALHPAGQLGRYLQPVTNVMRSPQSENLSIVPATGTVHDALTAASRPRRSGAVLLTDANGSLAGILTDADLRRLIVKLGPSALEQPVTEIMTRSPKHLNTKATVQDAVNLITQLRVDELPVLDPTGKPVGLVDIQDLIALKVIKD